MGIEFFYDNTDYIGDKPLLVKARITLLRTEDGGKKNSVTQHYRPNHNFDGPENRNFYIGEIELQKNECLSPGESRELIVAFFNVRGLAEKLTSGRQWRIQEGSKLVGMGEIINTID